MPPRVLSPPLAALLALALLASTLSATPASAQSLRLPIGALAQNDSRPAERRARISSAQAAAIAQQRYGGQVMNVSSRQQGGSLIYRVRILQSSGHMRNVNVHGDTGAILN